MGLVALLDTHALAWLTQDPCKLSPQVRALLEDPDNAFVVSSVTAYEMALKHRLGKWPEVAPLLERFFEVLHELGFETLPISPQHALLAGRLEAEHRDPWDRLLAAQASLERLPLVSADPAFGQFAGLEVVW